MHFRYNNFHTTALARLFASLHPFCSPFRPVSYVVFVWVFNCHALLRITADFVSVSVGSSSHTGFPQDSHSEAVGSQDYWLSPALPMFWQSRYSGGRFRRRRVSSAWQMLQGCCACKSDTQRNELSLYQASSDLYFWDIFKIQFYLEFVLYLTSQNFRQHCYIICKVIK